MTLTENRVSLYSERAEIVKYEVDATVTKIFEGAILAADSTGTGKLLLGADTANFRFRGISLEEFPEIIDPSVQTITPDDQKIELAIPGSGRAFQLPIISSVDETDIGSLVFIVDDESVDLTAGTTNDVLVGTIIDIIDANTVIVRI